MHEEAFTYVGEQARRHGPLGRVLELGSRNVNGSVREHFAWEGTTYEGVDLAPGEGVDRVVDARCWRADAPFDAVVCCELLEHCPGWEDVIVSAYANLAASGYLILTCAVAPRAPHGCSGNEVLPGEHYENPDPGRVLWEVLAAGFEAASTVVDRCRGDLYLTAVKGPGGL